MRDMKCGNFIYDRKVILEGVVGFYHEAIEGLKENRYHLYLGKSLDITKLNDIESIQLFLLMPFYTLVCMSLLCYIEIFLFFLNLV